MNKKNNSKVYIITVVIIIVWFLLIYFSENIKRMFAWEAKAMEVIVIDDSRCTNCSTDQLVNMLKQAESMKEASFNLKDFSDEWVEEYMIENWLKNIPTIILSNDNVENEIKDALSKMKDGNYLVNTWMWFNPFFTREKLEEIKSNSYIKWNRDAKITWLEYSDLECPYCARLHNSDVESVLTDKYWDDLNIVFNHFPLVFHNNAQIWAEILECTGEQLWSDGFYSLIKKAFSAQESKKEFLISTALELWVSSDELLECIDSWKYTQKVKDQADMWNDLFWITWTPWNVLINNETLEYTIIGWAYPKEEFIKVIDSLLK